MCIGIGRSNVKNWGVFKAKNPGAHVHLNGMRVEELVLPT